MPLFKSNYNTPGPGVPKNAPRKKGFARFWEVLSRDFSNLVKLNLLYQLCILLPQALLAVTLLSLYLGGGYIFLIAAALALVACIPLGPATTAMYHIVTKMLRDEPGFVWHDFKKLFKENFKSSLVPGLIYGLIVGAQAFALVYFFEMGADLNWLMIGLYILSLLIFTMATPYFFTQASYLEIGLGGLLKNSVLMALGYLPRSFMGALQGSILVIPFILFFPVSVSFALFIYPFFGYTIPCLLTLMWTWKPVNRTFKIEQTLVERTGAEWVDPDPAPPPKAVPPKPGEGDDSAEEEEEEDDGPTYLEYEDYMQDEVEEERKAAEAGDDEQTKDPADLG